MSKKEVPAHDHKWSLQKDAEFAEESARLLSYFVNAQLHTPCVHQDHPTVAAIEIMADSFARNALPVPGLSHMVETIAHIFFAAGQQYARDGFSSSAHPAYKPDVGVAEVGSEEEWAKAHGAYTSEWRKDIREKYYLTRPKKNLADLLNHIVENHGDELDGMDEKTILSRILGIQRTAPEQDDRYAGPYL